MELININETYIPLVSVIIGAFIGAMAAILAQLVSHYFTKRRESDKYNKEIYQKLYAPILLDIYAFYDIKTNFRRGHDINDWINEDDIRNKIITHIGTNLMYAEPVLISAFHEVKKYEYYEDFSGFYYLVKDYDLLLIVLETLEKLSIKNKLFNKEISQTINRYKIKYLLWKATMHILQDSNKSIEIMSLDFMFDSTKYKRSIYKKMKNIYNKSTLKEKVIFYWYKIIKRKYNNSTTIEHLKAMLQLIIRKENWDQFSNILDRDTHI
jgi:hypothetical protein